MKLTFLFLANFARVHADGDNRSDRYDPAATPDLEGGGVDSEVGSIPFYRAIEERLHLAVDLFAKAADLALRKARHTHGFDQVATERVEIP